MRFAASLDLSRFSLLTTTIIPEGTWQAIWTVPWMLKQRVRRVHCDNELNLVQTLSFFLENWKTKIRNKYIFGVKELSLWIHWNKIGTVLIEWLLGALVSQWRRIRIEKSNKKKSQIHYNKILIIIINRW